MTSSEVIIIKITVKLNCQLGAGKFRLYSRWYSFTAHACLREPYYLNSINFKDILFGWWSFCFAGPHQLNARNFTKQGKENLSQAFDDTENLPAQARTSQNWKEVRTKTLTI